ncbi:MAG: trimeric intracellular cation channel family protein [Acidobacteriia bacterium]|nr:trimeric intracellular cation channel family protein [Terriglobia bacterium]
MEFHSAHLLLAIDLIGTALFAAEGASAASQAHLDLFGVLVLSFAMALGGGIIRDLLIGDVPPSAIRDWRYAATALTAGAFLFLLHTTTAAMNFWLLATLDAAGLAFFAVAGAAKALDFGLHPLPAIIMGGITGVGGGTIRDIFLAQIPVVLRSEIYATAALLGAAVTILLLKAKLPPAMASTLGIVACFAVRMLAVYHHWNLPRA